MAGEKAGKKGNEIRTVEASGGEFTNNSTGRPGFRGINISALIYSRSEPLERVTVENAVLHRELGLRGERFRSFPGVFFC